MSARNLKVAEELCEKVKAKDLLDWMGLDGSTTSDEAKAALKKKRSFYQSMQSNPKHKDTALFLIKNYRALDAVLDAPSLHIENMAEKKAAAHLPMLEMVIDGVLADGDLTFEEEAFVRENAINLGISLELYQKILRQRAEAAGVSLPADRPTPPALTGPALTGPAPTNTVIIPKLAASASGLGWWNEDFEQLLLDTVPENTQRLVDMAAGIGWGALTILPNRPRLEYLGVDNDPARLATAEKSLRNTPIFSRVALLPGEPHKLPIAEGAVDMALVVMAMHRFPDNADVYREAVRVIRPGGRVVIVEPDRHATQFWFDGELTELNAAYRQLMDECDANLAKSLPLQRAPSLSTGAQVAIRLKEAGLTPHKVKMHHVRESRIESTSLFADRVAAQVATMARRARLRSGNRALQTVNSVIDDLEHKLGTQTKGAACWSMPVFATIALKS